MASSKPSPGRGRNPIAPSATTSVAPSGVPYGYVPAFLPGSASLVEELDRRLLVVLRDGRHLVGTLRSFDQYSNMVMEDTSERKMCCKDGVAFYADLPLGLYVVRGDSIVLLGQTEDSIPAQDRLERISAEELKTMIAESGTGAYFDWDFDGDLIA